MPNHPTTTEHDVMRIEDLIANGHLADAGHAINACPDTARVVVALISRAESYGFGDAAESMRIRMTQIVRTLNAAEATPPLRL